MSFWGCVGVVLMMPEEYVGYETIAMLIFVLVTCWYNPMFYSTTRKHAEGCKKFMLILYWSTGYLLGILQISLVFWFLFDCVVEDSGGSDADGFHNSTALNSTFQTTEAITYDATCKSVHFESYQNTNEGKIIGLFGIDVDSNLWQDMIMLVTLIGGFVHYIPSTGYLFYSSPIAFCISHTFSILAWLFIPVIQLRGRYKFWHYGWVDETAEPKNPSVIEPIVIFIVAFAMFLSWSGMKYYMWFCALLAVVLNFFVFCLLLCNII